MTTGSITRCFVIANIFCAIRFYTWTACKHGFYATDAIWKVFTVGLLNSAFSQL